MLSNIINDIRNLMNQKNVKQMNQVEITNELQRINPARYNARGFSKDNVLDALNHYKTL